MKKVFIVRLTETERSELDALVRKGKASALTIARARILLKADQGNDGEARTDAQVADALSVAAKTVFNVRRRSVEEGLEAALHRKKQDCPSRSRASFYEAFAPNEARRLTERLEIHYTPKHGSWLNIAECELSVLGRQCLARRIDDGQRLAEETAAWERDRNLRATQVN